MSISKAIALAVVVLLGNCPTDPARPRDREADDLRARGAALLEAESPEQARALLSEALRRHLSIGDHRAASTDAVLLSQVHERAKRFGEAIRVAELAREYAVRSADAETLAGALIALGDTFVHVGDHPPALEAYREAARYLPESDKQRRGRLAIYTSAALISMGRRREARRELEEALELGRAAGDHRQIVGASANLADIALTEGLLDDARRYLDMGHDAQRRRTPPRPSPVLMLNESELARLRGDLSAATAALDRIERVASEDVQYLIAYERGAIAEAFGHLALAEWRFQHAVDIVERQRADFALDDARAPFLEERWEPYADLFALRLRRGDPRGAFDILALAQGRMFLDTLAVSLAETAAEMTTRIDGAVARVSRLERAMPVLAGSVIRGTHGPDQTLAGVRGKHILAYFPARERLRMLTVVDGQPRDAGVDVALGSLDRLIDAFGADPNDEAAAEALGQALLPPGSLPAPPARIYIVPVGPLLRVSFAALRVSGRRLLDRYEIVYAPSVTALAGRAAEREAGVEPGLVLADTRSHLAHAGVESRIVVEHTGATARVGGQATVAALRAAAQRPLLHVISHSGLGTRGGYLVLADGQVTAADIMAWRVGPPLVVLPTCASAATVRNEMWDSLAAAFLAAGSRHVVATVASVEDKVATEFTRHFYGHGGASDPVRGVTRALREMARTHPVSAWSAFVVAGL